MELFIIHCNNYNTCDRYAKLILGNYNHSSDGIEYIFVRCVLFLAFDCLYLYFPFGWYVNENEFARMTHRMHNFRWLIFVFVRLSSRPPLCSSYERKFVYRFFRVSPKQTMHNIRATFQFHYCAIFA